MRRGADALALLLHVGDDAYAVACVDVETVIPRPRLRVIPSAPPSVLGVFVFRGRVVPVVDLGLRLGFAPTPDVLSSRVVLVRAHGRELGVLAAQVSDVVPLPRVAAREASPRELALSSVVLHEGRAVIWLDVSGLLSDDVAALLEGAP